MKSFGFLILFALITFSLGISRETKCTITEDGKEKCCWWNSNTCCEYRPHQKCGMAFRRCCETHDLIKNRMDINPSKIKLFPKTKNE